MEGETQTMTRAADRQAPAKLAPWPRNAWYVAGTPDEMARIELDAVRLGLTITDYCRHAALDRPVRVIVAQRADHGPILSELTRIGVNLNQIARAANATGALAADLPDTLAQLRALMVRLDPEVLR